MMTSCFLRVGNPFGGFCSINHAGIKRIIELETAMANMAVEVAKLRIEVDALIEQNPPKGLPTRKKQDVIIYKEEDK